MRFTISAIVDALVDGSILGVVGALFLVTLRGPISLRDTTNPSKGRSRNRQGQHVASTEKCQKRSAGLRDYVEAWLVLMPVLASASFTVAGGQGHLGIVHGILFAVDSGADPGRLALMSLLNSLLLALLGGAVWTVIWWLGTATLRTGRRILKMKPMGQTNSFRPVVPLAALLRIE